MSSSDFEPPMCESATATFGKPWRLIIPCATSILKPAAPRSSQKRKTSSNISRTFSLSQLRSGCDESKMCKYHWPSSPFGSVMRVQELPPKTDCQLFGGSSPFLPRPSRNIYISRSGDPGAAFKAALKNSCSLDEWFGTKSTMIRMPCFFASATRLSKSARVPKSGSMSL